MKFRNGLCIATILTTKRVLITEITITATAHWTCDKLCLLSSVSGPAEIITQPELADYKANIFFVVIFTLN